MMLLGDTNMYQGLLDDNELKGIKSRSNLEAALALMAASGPSVQPMNFGQVLLSGLQQGRKAQQEGLQGAVGAMDLREKLAERKNQQMIQGQMAQMLQGADSADKKAQAYRNVGDMLSSAGKVDQAAKYYDIADKLIPKVEAFTLGEGQVRYGQDGKIVAQGPEKKEATPAEIKGYELAKQEGFNGTFMQYQTALRKSGASMINLADPTAVAKAAMSFQNDVRTAFKDDEVIGNQYNAMKQAVQNPSAQGDTALLYSFFKILDPQSTVREGELDMVMGNRSIPDKFKGYAQKLAEGQPLLPKERQDLLSQATRQVEARKTRSDRERKAYTENALRLQLDPNTYVPDPYANVSVSNAVPMTPAEKARAELKKRMGN